MYHLASSFRAGLLVLTLLVCWLPAEPGAAEKPVAAGPEPGLFDVDPDHLWNRLYKALHVRKGREGEYDDDGEPFYTDHGGNLLEGASHQRAIDLLDEFLDKNGDRKIQDPLKRAVMQRDTWMVLDWSTQSSRPGEALSRLRLRLARAVQRLALTDEQIEALPDNYARAVESRAFAADFDAARPAMAFLPPDLFKRDGNWVALGQPWGAVAEAHLRFFDGRSSFVVLLRLPPGRKATEEYVRQLREYVALHRVGVKSGDKKPETPQFPAGTQVALVRRMCVVNRRGQVTPTRLTESVQLRVFVDPTRSHWGALEGEKQLPPPQHFYEIKIDRKGRHELLAGRSSLRDQRDETDRNYLTLLGNAQDPEGTGGVLHTCRSCHNSPGIHSVNSFTGRFSDGPRPLAPSDLAAEQKQNAAFKRDFGLGFLQGIMNTQGN